MAVAESLLGVCFLLMASLFAVSASFQFNDADWYFWIPLYSCACTVNLVRWAKPRSRMRKMRKCAFWVGLLLFIKVGVEDLMNGNGLWGLDMRERGVRERLGSGLVVISMFLLRELDTPINHPTQLTKYGMPILVGIAYGLSFLFFRFQQHQITF